MSNRDRKDRDLHRLGILLLGRLLELRRWHDKAAPVDLHAGLERGAPELRPSGSTELWYASPHPRDLPNLPRAANLAGVSMACANLTGFLASQALAQA